MARASMGNPLPLKGETQSLNKDISSSFKSLKRSLKDTLERLETIGINDFEAPDEVTSLKIQLQQKDKIIAEQAMTIEKLNQQLLMLSTSVNKSIVVNSDIPSSSF